MLLNFKLNEEVKQYTNHFIYPIIVYHLFEHLKNIELPYLKSTFSNIIDYLVFVNTK